MAFLVLPGKDASGNGNDWTSNNINYTTSTSTTYDIMSDVPTLTDEDTGNFCTINPTTCNEGTISNGNLTIDHNGSAGKFYLGTIGMPSGKWYFEAKVLNMSSNSRHTIGFCKAHESYQSFQIYMGGSSSTYHCLFYNGAQYEGTTIARTISSLAQPASGTIINVAIDVDNNKVFFGKNGTWQNSGNPVAGTGQCINLASNTEWVLATGAADNSSNSIHNNDWDFNFGQQPFAYTPPTGYKKLNTYNLPDSAIKDGSQYFNTVTYNGTSSSNTISTNMYNDLTWLKMRSSTGSHYLWDSVRGFSNTKALDTRQLAGEGINSAYYTVSRKSDNKGFIINDASGGNEVNSTGNTYVAWNWRANDGSSGASNTSGSITSTVSANTTSGFSIVTYSGNSTAGATVGHGLGVAPDFVVVKVRNVTGKWTCYHSALGNTKYVEFSSTIAGTTSSTAWNNTSPNVNTFTLGTYGNVNGGYNYVAYCFAEVEGFSKFGSYTGNGTTPAGPFVYTGFRPSFIIVKRTDAAYGWVMFDNKRDTYNYERTYILANSNGAEATQVEGSGSWTFDFFANGFRPTGGSAANAINATGGTFVYMAFAENPFKNSLAR